MFADGFDLVLGVEVVGVELEGFLVGVEGFGELVVLEVGEAELGPDACGV